MAQLVAVGLLGVLLTVATIVRLSRSPQTGRSSGRYPSLGSVGDIFRTADSGSLPGEGFEDWKLYYLRIAISALPPRRWLAIAPGAALLTARAGVREGSQHADAG